MVIRINGCVCFFVCGCVHTLKIVRRWFSVYFWSYFKLVISHIPSVVFTFNLVFFTFTTYGLLGFPLRSMLVLKRKFWRLISSKTFIMSVQKTFHIILYVLTSFFFYGANEYIPLFCRIFSKNLLWFCSVAALSVSRKIWQMTSQEIQPYQILWDWSREQKNN